MKLPEINELHDRYSREWHKALLIPDAVKGLERLILEQHLKNFELWHEEDLARQVALVEDPHGPPGHREAAGDEQAAEQPLIGRQPPRWVREPSGRLESAASGTVHEASH